MKITAKKIKKSSLFKLFLIGFGIPCLFFFVGCGIASYFGAETVKWNGEQVIGLKGLIAAILMYPFFTFFFSAFLWLPCVFGLWIYSYFGNLSIEYRTVINEETNA
jgi:hypothetical protein